MQNFRKFSWHTISKTKKSFAQYQNQVQFVRHCSTTEVTHETKEAVKFQIPRGIMGQPTCHTHPHLIPKGQLTCGITQAEYRDRRITFVHKLLNEAEHPNYEHLIVIPASGRKYMSDRIPYTFRQNSDFFYLTGCLEPSATLVLIKPAYVDTLKSVLFVHEKDYHSELWEGPRTGCTAAEHLFAVDEAQPVEMFQNYVEKAASQKSVTLWYNNDDPPNEEIDRNINLLLKKNNQLILSNPKRALHLMRVIKSPAEVELMKETCFIGSQAMNMAMCCTKPGMSEHMVNAVLDYTCRQGGAEHLAFPPVVAGGPRATHIHYVANNQILTAQDLLLVDNGSQRWMYNSDISRTWPVSGKFTKYQQILYEIVLTVQKRLIELVGENRPSLDQLFDQMCRLLGTYLQQEGILPKNSDPMNLIEQAYRLCPHHVSHYLGLDVHDAPLVRRHVPVTTNMVVTIEPGIYIARNDMSVRKEFRGTGIRIEDDVLITDDAPVVLTESCFKEIEEIEANVGKHTL